ncbi:MAG: DUF6364 family protein [Balneolaceae bacterium]
MKNKLTLRLESSLIKRAKKHAKRKGTSVSRLVADYFAIMDKEEPDSSDGIRELPPVTASLAGILKHKDIQDEEYKAYLEEKYLK